MTISAAQSALDHAWHLVRKGEIIDARFWASQASNMDPGLEEAWLIMAATSDPNVSFEYLKRALDVNPNSRRGKRGVSWAEEKTGRSFSEYISGFHNFINELDQPYKEEPYQAFDITPFEIASEETSKDDVYSSPKPEVKPAPPPVEIEPPPTIIRRRKLLPKPVEPLNPWSVLLPYTVSFVIFFFLSAVWLLSGLPNVKAESVSPNYSTDELVKQILTAIPKSTATITPSVTPSLTRTPTKMPTITQTFTPQPIRTEIPPTPEITEDYEYSDMPILIGDQIFDTLEDGRWVEVDLTHQKVRAYETDKIVNEFLVSTGTAAHPTVKGSFHIYIKNRYADMRGPGYYLPNVPYTMYFYQSYGLHGTYWHHNFGTPMSHGCVNLKTDDAAWLFSWASLGTLVYVH